MNFFNHFLVVLLIACVSAEDNLLFSMQERFVPASDVLLNLFTRKNPTTPQVLINGDAANLAASNFQLDKPLKIFSHGWSRMADAPDLVEAFLAAGDVNVILIDWTKGTVGEESIVVSNAPLVGGFVATFIDWLSTFGLLHKNVHLIGVSLGSHVAGWTGRSCQKGTVEILTACDPSKKFWENSTDKVNAKDAKYVEVIHSNTAYHGLILPTGTVDFYPNGGATNPGCNNDLCDHMRSLEFFVDSIDHKKFVAQKCNNYEEIVAGKCANLETSFMGGSVVKNITGVFYLTTNAQKPYYKE